MKKLILLPRFWFFPPKLLGKFNQRRLWVLELEHRPQVNLSAEEISVHEFAGGKEGTFLVNECGE